MTTLEKLFVGIFERKDWIIEQLQREADAYTEELASRLLIDGITPPPCLLNPRFNSRSSNPHDLKKEEIISELLLGPPRSSVAYSRGGPSHYYRPAVTGGHGPLPNEMSMETHAPNKALHVTNEPPVTLANDNNECSLNVVNDQVNNVNFPQNKTDARISSIYAAPDSSLARIQRSKSRQKALELRNSGKTSAKSCLGDENRIRISFSGDLLSKSDIHQVTQDKHPIEVDKSNDITQGKSLQQSCHDNGVNVVDTSLGSYEAKKTVTGLTNSSHRQSKLYYGRITRSGFSTQQTSGTNKSLEKDTCVSCIPKEGKDVLSDSAGDLNLGVSGSKKFLDAVETSQVVKDVQKPVVSSNIVASRVTRSKSGSIKECPLGVNHKEDGEIVMGNMLVQPKQLNFDEMDGCDSSKISSLVSKKRKPGQECSPLMDSALLKDHKSSGTFFEQKVQMENLLSSQSKSARTHSNEDSDECTNVDMDENENPMVVGQECNPILDSDSLKHHKSSGTFFEQKVQMENELPSQLEDEKTHSHEDLDECAKDGTMDTGLDMNADMSLHDDGAVLCEVDFHNKGEKSADGVFIPVSKEPKSSFTSSLIKQRDKNSEIFLDKEVRTSYQDLGSLRSKEFEVGTNSKLSNLKLNSAKFNTWPRDPQKKVDDQRKCLSDSQGSKIHAQKDTIHCDLEAFKDDLHVTKSDDIQESDNLVHDDIMCDSLEKTEATVMEVDDETTYDVAADVANSDQTSNDDVAVSVDESDENMPVYEGFTINEELENTEIDFDTLEIPTTTTERASLLEQICKDSITNTPFSQFSSFKENQVQDLYKIIPDELLEDINLEKQSDCDYSFPNSLPFSGTPFKSKNYYSSPVGKLYDRSASSSGSSENRLSSNPELTCFPIEEDPNGNEESENDDIQEKEEKFPITVSKENDDDVAVPKPANHELPMKYCKRCSSNSVSIEVNVPKTFDKVKYKSKFDRTPSISTRASVRRNTPMQTQNSIRRNASLQTQNSKIKSSIHRQRPSQKEGKRNNIVSNITSFVSLVQQKQAAAACPGKRDIKVKALEAAEVARRREEEKEKERKMKKEALKMERARIEKENAREMEINKKRKMEEMRKKEADVAARKKQREEDERKQMAKKRKINEARKGEKRGGKVVIVGNKKGAENASENKNEQEEISVTENVEKEKSPKQVGLTSQEESFSYEISPYKCSDDEDEDEDELPNKKFVPSWASKTALAMVLPMQQEVDPETIFPVESFCSMDQVLLPRRLQAQ